MSDTVDYAANYAASSSSSGGGSGSSSNAAAGSGSWVPGLLELPYDEDRRAKLAIRASWPIISQNLQNRAKVTTSIRNSVEKIEGTQDEVLADMVQRHVRASPFFFLLPPFGINLLLSSLLS